MFEISGKKIKPGSRVTSGAQKPKKPVKPVPLKKKPLAKKSAPQPVIKKKNVKKKKSVSVPKEEEKPKPQPEPQPQPEPEPQPILNNNGLVTIRYNHYDKKFPIKNGSMTAADIDDQYALLFAYPNAQLHLQRGSSQIDLYHTALDVTAAINTSNEKDDEGKSTDAKDKPFMVEESAPGVYIGLEDDCTYWVVVEEDPLEREKYEQQGGKGAFVAADLQNQMNERTRAADDITKELRGMSTKELQEKGTKYKELIEARDLEDCLYNQ